MPDETVGLLLSRDLIFTSKVTGTARALGHVVLVAGDRAVASRIIEERSPRVVFIDLAAGDLGAAPALTALKEAAGPKIPFVAFGSHVDTQALDGARAAGCAVVLPRSRFTAELPQLVERFLGAGPINHTDGPGSVMPN